MNNLVPIPTLHLFPVLDKLLIELLRSLSSEDWNKPTLAKLWTVKDVAAHLLDTNFRAISSHDGYIPPAPQDITSYQDLVTYLNGLNAVWVKAMQRVSPGELTDQLERTGKQYITYLSTLDPFATARFSVAWAGEEQSKNWFHIAREYTEKWHHQQQIRDAVGKTDALLTRELFYPCIDTFMCGLPHAYRNVEADKGSVIQITIGDDNWHLEKAIDKWHLNKDKPQKSPAATVNIAPDIAWKVFTKGITPANAIERSQTNGDTRLAESVFKLVAVMA